MQTTWDDWAQHHGLMFGLTTEQDLTMILKWANVFGAGGITVHEAWEASDWLALNEPLTFRNQHLAALQQRLAHTRRLKAWRPPDEVPEETCGECDSTGLVSVPNPKADVLGMGWTTMAVACPCRAGRRLQDRGSFLSLREYERGFPDWRERMRQHAEYLRGSREATALTRSVDQALGAIRSRRRPAAAAQATTLATTNPNEGD